MSDATERDQLVGELAQAMADANLTAVWTHPQIIPMGHFAEAALDFLTPRITARARAAAAKELLAKSREFEAEIDRQATPDAVSMLIDINEGLWRAIRIVDPGTWQREYNADIRAILAGDPELEQLVDQAAAAPAGEAATYLPDEQGEESGDIVETAARALCRCEKVVWNAMPAGVWDLYRSEARAVLDAVRPLIAAQERAKVAEETLPAGTETRTEWATRMHAHGEYDEEWCPSFDGGGMTSEERARHRAEVWGRKYGIDPIDVMCREVHTTPWTVAPARPVTGEGDR